MIGKAPTLILSTLRAAKYMLAFVVPDAVVMLVVNADTDNPTISINKHTGGVKTN